MLEELISYTQAADEKLIEIFEQQKDVSPKAVSLFNHVLNAQHIWANRVLGLPPKYAVWENYGSELFREISKDNFEMIGQIFKKNIDLDQELTYSTSTGGTYKSLVKDILFHIVNHSTYHRAQIVSMLKLDGINPPVTDYIILKRNHQL